MINVSVNAKIKKVILALFATLLLFILYFQFNIMSVTDYFKLSKKSLNITEKNVIGLKNYGKMSFTSVTADPNISFTVGNKKIANISIYINDISVQNMNAQVYVDNGKGFNEVDSYSFHMRKGKNTIKLNEKNYIKAVRFDPTSTIGEAFKVNKIELNDPSVSMAVFFGLPLIFIIIFSMAYISKRYILSTVISTLLSYNIILFLDKFQLDSKAKYMIFLFLVLIVIVVSIFTSLLGNRIEKRSFIGDDYE